MTVQLSLNLVVPPAPARSYPLVEDYYLRAQRCPLCNKLVKQSEYLSEVITDPKVLYLANLVTHYRHTHITSWNKMWGPGGRYYREAAKFGDYEAEKKKVNERAKRQLIRKASRVFANIGITSAHFGMLQGTSDETNELAIKILNQKLCSKKS